MNVFYECYEWMNEWMNEWENIGTPSTTSITSSTCISAFGLDWEGIFLRFCFMEN